jgi:hypothetical protein
VLVVACFLQQEDTSYPTNFNVTIIKEVTFTLYNFKL